MSRAAVARPLRRLVSESCLKGGNDEKTMETNQTGARNRAQAFRVV